MIKTIDNWLDKDLVVYLNDYFLYNFPHYYGHKSNDTDEHSFYNSNLNPTDALNNYLFFKLKRTLNLNLKLERIYINVQHSSMDGSFHTDDGDLTCLYMVTKSLKDCGYLEIKDEQKIDFIQNRLVAFDAVKKHKGHAPDKGNVRITLAFKTFFIK
tara:strand:- start:430 stop:897 length:468 start_codon:yes stop_codon:yes gene_type:complete